MPAAAAYTIAKQLASVSAWEWRGDTATRGSDRVAEGWEIVLEVMPDDDNDYSHLGEFTDTWEEGAVAHSTDPREYKYFVPAISEEEHYKGLRGQYGKNEARRLARSYVDQDRRAAAEYQSCYVKVSVMLDGRELGSAGMGGVDADDRSYFESIGDDLMDEAIDDAYAFVEKLQS